MMKMLKKLIEKLAKNKKSKKKNWKITKNYETQFSINQMLNDKIEKKIKLQKIK